MAIFSLTLGTMTTVCESAISQAVQNDYINCRDVIVESRIEKDGEMVTRAQNDKRTIKKVCGSEVFISFSCCVTDLCLSILQEALEVTWTSKPARYFKRTPPTWFIVQCRCCVSNQIC